MLSSMRLVKDKTEIATMRKAAKCSALAHREMMRFCRTDMRMRECDLAAIFTARALMNGADPLHAYPPIIATGENACTLHYTKNSAKIKDGDLVLVDAGCEINGYASDVTRTFPANGTFTDAQRIVYEIVLRAQKEAIAVATCGHTIGDVHAAAAFAIAEGLMQQGFLDYPDPKTAVLSGNVARFFPHGTSHWLGLDVHDVGDYKKDPWGSAQQKLVPGMVLTVEPGIYIPKGMADVHQKFHGMGIRIEDDILITEKGNEVLSQNAPKEIEEIEGVMGKTLF
jgi:Xaa-Pro aminopeptidase